MRTPQEHENFELLCELETRISRQVERDGFESLPTPARIIYAVWWLDADVSNGGFDQYFFNSWGDYSADALRGLQTIGAASTADTLRRATAVFPSPGPSPDRTIRGDQLEAFSPAQEDVLEALDNEFFERPDDLEGLLADFARRNADILTSIT